MSHLVTSLLFETKRRTVVRIVIVCRFSKCSIVIPLLVSM